MQKKENPGSKWNSHETTLVVLSPEKPSDLPLKTQSSFLSLARDGASFSQGFKGPTDHQSIFSIPATFTEAGLVWPGLKNNTFCISLKNTILFSPRYVG
ncbi:hypothetical protein AVEN_121059-1 [Araneus ventricosus]|uniref:Uncharacterized protein n=1 Tax=Araneus ventricosus TaxID=182803 RepID=A0A4Y2MJP2_ARAVE|nr:hypothetical protein AVEN_121059-1 [Araneus ventricosus]